MDESARLYPSRVVCQAGYLVQLNYEDRLDFPDWVVNHLSWVVGSHVGILSL